VSYRRRRDGFASRALKHNGAGETTATLRARSHPPLSGRSGRPSAREGREGTARAVTTGSAACAGRSGPPHPRVLARLRPPVRRRWLALLLLVGCATALDAAPVQVRFTEGVTRGFLTVRTPQGERIGHGELRQTPRGDEVETRLLLQLKNGSVHDETTTFSQRGVFRLEAYRLTQRGPSFPGAEVSFDRKSGRYEAKTHQRTDGREETASGELEMPADLYNGMALLVLKNLPPGEAATAQFAAFTPKPRLLRMELRHEGEDRVVFAGDAKLATRHLVHLEIGGLTGAVASLVGKTPPDLRYWLVIGDVPAFVRFEGAMFLNGPVWRVEMAGVE
jgi:hypothetical protein